MSDFVCPGCGHDDRLYRQVEVTLDTEVAVKVRTRDGKPRFEDDHLDTAFLDLESALHKSRTVYCECGAKFDNADGLRVVWHAWRPGDVAILPDGLKGTIDTVNGDKLTVVGWHEVFEPGDLTPLTGMTCVERLAA